MQCEVGEQLWVMNCDGGDEKKDGEIGVTTEKYGSTDSLTHCRVRH